MKSLGEILFETETKALDIPVTWDKIATVTKNIYEHVAQDFKSAVLAQNAIATASEASEGVQTADAAEIKPCPFCGGEVKIDDYGFSTPDEKLWEPYWMCGCIKCGICMPNTQESQNKQEAINAWNKRA